MVQYPKDNWTVHSVDPKILPKTDKDMGFYSLFEQLYFLLTNVSLSNAIVYFEQNFTFMYSGIRILFLKQKWGVHPNIWIEVYTFSIWYKKIPR